eukprot:Polyplicarium_translucidae@DN642_c0_g1_i1.p1
MRDLPRIEYSVILPTYNERENLPLVTYHIVKNLRECNVSFELIVVGDSSPDGTGDVFQALEAVYPEENLVLLRRPGKLGLGSAYRDGLKRARGRFVFLLDADLSHNPKYFKQFILEQRVSDWDIVSGTRYKDGGGVCGWGLKRVLISRGANFLAQTLLAPKGSDLTSSFRLYKKTALDHLMRQVVSKGYVFQMEIMVRATRAGFSIGEVPIVFVDRLYGVSNLGGTEIVQFIKGLCALAFWD